MRDVPRVATTRSLRENPRRLGQTCPLRRVTCDLSSVTPQNTDPSSGRGSAAKAQDPRRPAGRVVAGQSGRQREAAGPFPPCSGPLSPCTDFTFSDTVVQSSHVPLPHCFIIIKMLLCISFNHFKIKDELPRTFSLSLPGYLRQDSPPPPALSLSMPGSLQQGRHHSRHSPRARVAYRFRGQQLR